MRNHTTTSERRLFKMNKAGKGNKLVISGVIALVLILAILAYAVVLKPSSQTVIGGSQTTGGSTGGSIVTTNPTINVDATDALVTGTSVGVTALRSVNGGAFASTTLGTSTAVPGQTLDMLIVNNTAYHNAVVKGILVNPGTFPLSASLFGNQTLTITAFNTNNQVIDNSATNQTVAAGGSYTMTVRVDGAADKSTQDMVLVIEGNGTALKDGTSGVSFSGPGAAFVGQSKPSVHSLSNVANDVWVYNVEPVVGAASKTYTIQVNTESGKTLAGSTVVLSFYTKENFVDSRTGKLAYDIVDSSGTAKSIAKYSKTIQFT